MNYAWLKGKNAFKKGKSLTHNPYDSIQQYRAWCDWNLGYEEQKRWQNMEGDL